MLPLVSVLIPCYNAEPWVAQTLESAFAQTWPRLEIIVVNDGSTDGTKAVLNKFKPLGLRVIDQANRGQTAALNRCLQEARGDYVQYLDADDLLAADKIAVQMERLGGSEDCIASAEWARFATDAGAAVFKPDPTWRDLPPVDWLVANWHEGGGMMYPAMWLLPRKLVDRIGPWREELTLTNDTEYFARAVLASEKVIFCAGARTYYRSGLPGSLSGNKTPRGWQSQFNVIDACVTRLLQRECSDRTRRVAAMLWQRFAQACYPYQRNLANAALAAAARLHADQLPPEGGRAFKIVSNLLGWKFARTAQRLTGRP